MKFIYNPKTNVIHRNPSSERCNVDDMKVRKNTDTIPNDARLCSYCFRPDRGEG